jgi:NTE family protein
VAAESVVVGGLDGLDPEIETEQFSVGLALSGGGARGLAVIGILRAFEERGIDIAAISGTSIGGVIGGLYACGYTSDDLAEMAHEIDFALILANRPHRSSMFLSRRQERERYLLSVRFDGLHPEIPQALTGAQELTTLLASLTLRANYLCGGDFSQLPIPYKTIATDIVSGESVIFANGSLADAMRATMAFPLAFTGLEQGDSLLMDGGMLIPVPVEIVRGMISSQTPVIAVNTSSPLLDRDELYSPVDVANQVTSIMTADKLAYQLSQADLVITPVPDRLTSSDFAACDSLIELGHQAGLKAADSIMALIHTRRDSRVYDPVTFSVVSSDSALAAKFRRSGLDRSFTRRQLVSDLKTLARTENAWRATADFRSDSTAAGDSSSVPVALTVVVEPKPRLAEMSFVFLGNTIYNDETLRARCGFRDSLLSPVALTKAADRIRELYRSEGYDLADVHDTTVDLQRKEVVFKINEGVIRRFDVVNNSRTRDWLVRSYFSLKSGEPFSTSRAIQGLSDLYGTELFDRVSMKLSQLDHGVLMTVAVNEKSYSQVRLGWHWHDEYESEEFVEFLDDNVNGVGLEFLTHLQYGPDREVYFTSLSMERIFFTYFTADIGFHYTLLDRNLFDQNGTVNGYRDEDRYGASLQIGQQLGRLGQVTAGLNFEHVELKDHLNDTRQEFELRTFSFRSTIESFDDYPFPTRGKKHLFDITFAGKLFGSEIDYSRFFASIEGYYPLTDFLNYHPRVAIGLSRRGLPASEKFYVGGLHSFAGYRVNELSGDKMFLINQQLRLKLPFWFYLTGFVDIGDVYGTTDDIKFSGLQQGFGASIAFDSPIGPFEFGYGTGDSPKDRWYFSAGFAF